MKINKNAAISLVLVLLVALAGCSGAQQSKSEDLERDTGEDLSDVKSGGSYEYEIKKTEKNQYGLVISQPPEGMERSLERQNLKERNKLLNNQNMMFYVYLMSHGKIVAKFTAKGKISSTNSKLTNDQQIVATEECLENAYREGEGACYQPVESPQMDGSYGTNGDGIFFFTTDNKYVEWNGEYIVSQQPLNIPDPIAVTMDVSEENDGHDHDHTENTTS